MNTKMNNENTNTKKLTKKYEETEGIDDNECEQEEWDEEVGI